MGEPAHIFAPGLKPDPFMEDPVKIQCELCTDRYAAKLFAETYGTVVRWVPEWGWLYWREDRRWALDTTGEVLDMMENVGNQYRWMAPNFKHPDTAKHLNRWARRMESAKGRRDALECAQHRLSAPSEDFDKNPWLVNCWDSTLDFERCDGTLPRYYEHSHPDYCTKLIRQNWRMDAPRGRWLSFLDRIMPDPEVQAFVKRAVGYSLLGHTNEQVFFLLHGSGCNGKSTFLDILLTVIGPDYAIQIDPSSLMSKQAGGIPNDLARLRGTRLVSAVETSEGRRLDEALVKALTGGDPIVARFLHKEFFEFRPTFKLWLATNHKPVIRDNSPGMWRRVRLVPFEQIIPEGERDRNLREKLLQESTGIFAWCVEGIQEYCEHGLNAPAGVLAATEGYRTSEDAIGQFISECTVLVSAARIAANELYKHFTEWGGTISQTRFGRDLMERGIERTTINGTRYYKGIGLRAVEGSRG